MKIQTSEVIRLDEREMLKALRDGDEGALGWFMERYATYAAAIIDRILLPKLPRSDAEEALADVFISLWRSAHQVPEGAVKPYIAAMARNRARDALRAHQAELPLEEAQLEIPDVSPEQALTEDEARERTAVYAIVNTLCGLSGVDGVRFLIEGESVETLTEYIYMRTTLLPNFGAVVAG